MLCQSQRQQKQIQGTNRRTQALLPAGFPNTHFGPNLSIGSSRAIKPFKVAGFRLLLGGGSGFDASLWPSGSKGTAGISSRKR